MNDAFVLKGVSYVLVNLTIVNPQRENKNKTIGLKNIVVVTKIVCSHIM